MRALTSPAPIAGGEIHGACAPRFERVRAALAANLASGADLGASAAVYLDGEPVVDLWGGHLDKARTQPWRRETIVNTFSTTKTMTALAMLVLADRDELDLDAPIAKYWPEFAQNGKARVLVRHVLGHTSGLPGWTAPVTLADILDREKAAALLARQAEWWPSGTKIAYHSITFGPLLGEVVCRITGKTLGRFFAEEIAGPLGADFHIGTGPECDSRVAPLIQSSPAIVPTPGDDIRNQVFFNPLVLPPDAFTLAWRRGQLGGSNGYGNARSVGAVQSVLACGGEARGVRLLSKAGCERALEQQAEGADIIAGFPLRWGMGYGIYNKTMDTIYGGRLSGRRVAFWGGSGGSIVVNDLDARMTVSYVMNKHVEDGGIDQRGVDIVVAAFDSLAGRELGPKPQWSGQPPAAA
jgi:CubicO group peptidase (beta-lactamase class C family)